MEPTRGRGDGEEGPAPLLLAHTDRPGSWQSESLLASSWSTISNTDLGDIHSLGGSASQVTDENHSSSSEPEALEQNEELGAETGRWRNEGQKTELSEFFGTTDEDIQAPQTQELLVSAEEPHTETDPTEFMQVVPPMALPPLPILKLDPPSNISTPVASTDSEELPSTLGLQPPSIFGPVNAPIVNTAEVQTHSVQASSERDDCESKPANNDTSTELPALLCGGAVLIAVIGVMAYGAMAICRK